MTGHWIGGFLLLGFSVIAMIFSHFSLPPAKSQELGARFFPLLISGFLLLVSALNLVLLGLKGHQVATPIEWPSRHGWLRIGTSLFLFLAYYLTLERFGYILTTLILLVLFARFVFDRPWVSSWLLGALAVLLSYGLLSVVLGVRLPTSPWSWF